MAANDTELARWRGFVWTTARNAWGAGNPPASSPISLDLTFYVLSDRKRDPRWLDPEVGAYRLATRGMKDLDKLERAVLDGLTQARVYLDDGLVTSIRSSKYFAAPPDFPPGVAVVVREI